MSAMRMEYTREILALTQEYARLLAIATRTMTDNDLALADRAWFTLYHRLLDNTQGVR